MLDTVTSAAPVVWVSTDCTTQTQSPSQVGCRLWGHCGPPPGLPHEQKDMQGGGPLLTLAQQPFCLYVKASNTRGTNPNKSIMEHMARSISGELLDTQSPEQFGCLLTKRRRDGAGGKTEPQGLQGLGCECSARGGMWGQRLCPPPWPAASPCPPRAASAALCGRECVGSGTTPRRAVC